MSCAAPYPPKRPKLSSPSAPAASLTTSSLRPVLSPICLGHKMTIKRKKSRKPRWKMKTRSTWRERSNQLRTQTLGQSSQLKVCWLLPRVLAFKALHIGTFCGSVCVWWQGGQGSNQTEGQRIEVPFRRRTASASCDPWLSQGGGWFEFRQQLDRKREGDVFQRYSWKQESLVTTWCWSCSGCLEENASYSTCTACTVGPSHWTNTADRGELCLRQVFWGRCVVPPSSKVAAVKDKGRTTVIQRGLDLKQVVVAKFRSMGCRSAIKDNNAWVFDNRLGGFYIWQLFFGRPVGWNTCRTFSRNHLATWKTPNNIQQHGESPWSSLAQVSNRLYWESFCWSHPILCHFKSSYYPTYDSWTYYYIFI